MNLADNYRPQSLDEIVGQPGVTRFLRHLVENPQRCCLLFEGVHGGLGKTSTAQAFAAELGCHDEFTGRWQVPASELTVDAARELFNRTLRLRWGSKSGFTVLIVDEFDWASPQTQHYLKTALDPAGSMPSKLITICTSNGAGGLDKPLLQRFRIFSFSSGPSFAAACQERLAQIWATECGDAPMPGGWLSWGQTADGYSMRTALAAMEQSIVMGGLARVA